MFSSLRKKRARLREEPSAVAQCVARSDRAAWVGPRGDDEGASTKLAAPTKARARRPPNWVVAWTEVRQTAVGPHGTDATNVP